MTHPWDMTDDERIAEAAREYVVALDRYDTYIREKAAGHHSADPPLIQLMYGEDLMRRLAELKWLCRVTPWVRRGEK